MSDVWHIETASLGSIYSWSTVRSPVVFPRGGSYQSHEYDSNDLGTYQPAAERLTTRNDHTSNKH